MTTEHVLLGAECEASGHPSECQETVSGAVQGDPVAVTVDGTSIATRDTAVLHFDSHAHDHSSYQGCHNTQSHDVVTDQTHPITVNGASVMFLGDSTSDPESGGTAAITTKR